MATDADNSVPLLSKSFLSQTHGLAGFELSSPLSNHRPRPVQSHSCRPEDYSKPLSTRARPCARTFPEI